MPISDCKVRDPRIRRTRQLLHRALRTLLQSRSFDELSVQDIADEATVNRATFYDHYTDKSALFSCSKSERCSSTVNALLRRLPSSLPPAIFSPDAPIQPE
jgi:hypothetical protein